MADESTLVRIADLARTLRAACPGDVANFRNAGETLQQCRNEPEYTTDRLTAHALHAYTAYRALVDEYAGHLRELLTLVYRHLPAEGRNLRELSRVDEPLERWDWNVAAVELHGIEVVALAATTPATTDDAEAELPDAFLSTSQLADRFSVPRQSLESRLRRWRSKNAAGNGWIEHDQPKVNEPRFLYRVDAVRDVILSLKSATDGDERATNGNFLTP